MSTSSASSAVRRHPDRTPTSDRAVPTAARVVGCWVLIFALMVGLGELVTGPLKDHWPLDVEDGINRNFAAGRTPTGTTWSTWFSALGNTSTIVPLCAVLFVLLRLVLHRWREAIFVATCTVGQSLVFLFTTLLIDRERPDVPKLDESPPTSSFPSGHTSAATALYLSLAVVVHRTVRNPWLRRGLIVLLALLPICVATGRLYRGMHHPSDVAAAALNGGLVLITAHHFIFAGQPSPERPDLGRIGPDRSGPNRTELTGADT
jgi:membrane-associated phospholipid phosphatase